MAKKDALQEYEVPGALARPSFIETSTEGTENITAEDMKLPRLAIAQGLSPQMIPGGSEYIDNLKLFQMFNDLSGEIYGNGPMHFIVVRRDVKRIEFEGEERKVPVDLDVPYGDPRTKWSKDPETGKGIPPRATKFVEFIILLLHPGGRPPEPLVMSIQETNKFNKKAHERLTGFIKMRQPPAPIYAGLYKVCSKSEKNDNGTFGVFTFENAGFVNDEKLYRFAKEFHDSMVGKEITYNREPGDDSFDPADLENDKSGM